MAKHLTPNQIIGEIGENAVRGRFLSIGFQFDGRSRLEAGIDGIAEVMDNGQPMARMIAVQVRFRGQRLTGESLIDSRLSFGGGVGRVDWII